MNSIMETLFDVQISSKPAETLLTPVVFCGSNHRTPLAVEEGQSITVSREVEEEGIKEGREEEGA